jgi:hypothetical protein
LLTVALATGLFGDAKDAPITAMLALAGAILFAFTLVLRKLLPQSW